MADAGHQKRIAVGRRMGGGLRPDEKVQSLTSALTGLQKKSASPTRRKGAIITGE
jgi:hypothetical protein